MITESEKAWLAAAIDAEGSISVRKDNLIMVTVANTCEEYSKRAADLMNTHYYRLNSGIYHAQLCSKLKVLELLKELLPYLIVKREKAPRVHQMD